MSARLRAILVEGALEPIALAPDVTMLRLSSRWSRKLRVPSTPYLVGDCLVDTGFSWVGDLLEDYLADRDLRAIACTHHHEDHVGNAGPLARAHGCPVYLHRPEARWTDQTADVPFYRWATWGPPNPYHAEAPGRWVETPRTRLRVVPTPGHAVTHAVFFEPERGWVFSGDLYVATGAGPVMAQENPYALSASLRRVAALEPTRMLTGHGGDYPDVVSRLERKAERIDEAAMRAVALHDEGVPAREIVARMWPQRMRHERRWAWITGGEFSRLNFVRAAIALRAQAGDGPST